MTKSLRYTQVAFKRFKAFKSFTLNLQRFNIMVGPNNAGKSTILAAFRILAAGLRTANRYRAEFLDRPEGDVYGYKVNLEALSIGEENIFFDYDASEPASVTFSLTEGKKLTLSFPEEGVCHLIADDPTTTVVYPREFRRAFNCPIGFVPILGPVEHDEKLYKKDAARLALFNYRAARNFRNIWFHYPENFESFRSILRETWPGMDIVEPEPDNSHGKTAIHMFCREGNREREIFWVGFGFQVWCQMLTHLVNSKDCSIFLIDEPDIYLHSDLQRQLLSLLQDLGPAILIATHSTEIISEAQPDEIVLIDKAKKRSKRITDPAQLTDVFENLGSNLNPILTQVAKTRRAVFVEGKDFQILSKYARRLTMTDLANRVGFAVVPIDGFSPDRVRSIKRGIEHTLGAQIRAAVLLDRDFRSEEECDAITRQCEQFCELAVIHSCKEVENFLLLPKAIDRAASKRVTEGVQRTAKPAGDVDGCAQFLDEFAEQEKSSVMAQFIESSKRYVRTVSPGEDDTKTTKMAVEVFESDWTRGTERKMELVPGKAALSAVNRYLQKKHGVNVTAAGIISAARADEIPAEIHELLGKLAAFSGRKTGRSVHSKGNWPS